MAFKVFLMYLGNVSFQLNLNKPLQSQQPLRNADRCEEMHLCYQNSLQTNTFAVGENAIAVTKKNLFGA